MNSGTFPNRPAQLLRLELRFEHDLVLARQRARQLAAALGFDRAAQTKITTALSEIARNAFQYAGGGAVDFAVENDSRVSRTAAPPRQTFLITVADRGPGTGTSAAENHARDGQKGLGMGIAGAQRLMDGLDIQTSTEGTTVVMRKALPASVGWQSPAQLQAIIDCLANQPPTSPVQEVQVQNQELLRTLEEVRAREQDLLLINQELTATNTGVLVLYDELDTLHRVGLMLAERHHLSDLLQTIIDATTELTGAELGAFYYHEAETATWRLNAFSGRERAALAQLPRENPAGLFGPAALMHAAIRVGEAEPGKGECECARWVDLLADFYTVRSCLLIPVMMANSELAGALVFGHAQTNIFTERSERIVSAIAVQAAVGIEKARLFHGMQSASEAKDRFLAMLSHELRTPLNPVTAILTSLSDDPAVPEHLREDIAVMRRNIDLEARLIDDLLDFNRIIRGKLHLDRTDVDLHALIQAVVQICEPDFANGRHSLRLELAAERATVSGDTARLQQVLWNLLKNALKFSASGGEISILTSLDSANGPLRIEIADAGCGIPADVLPTIFSAFDQGSLQPGRLGGLGLGLAIAKTFVDLHGGEISAASGGEGKGAQFTLRLPLLLDRGGQPKPANTVAATAAATQCCRRILLVDDHQDTLRTLGRLLIRRGHTVLGAASCAEALALADSQSFDLLISDIGLPDRSGLELLAEIRRNHRLPAIALSGYGMEADLASTQTAGFERHLTKPVNFTMLEAAIRELCAEV